MRNILDVCWFKSFLSRTCWSGGRWQGSRSWLKPLWTSKKLTAYQWAGLNRSPMPLLLKYFLPKLLHMLGATGYWRNSSFTFAIHYNAVHSVLWTSKLYNISCTVYSIHCVVHIVQHRHCQLLIIHYKLHIFPCTVYTVHCTLLTVYSKSAISLLSIQTDQWRYSLEEEGRGACSRFQKIKNQIIMDKNCRC